MGDKFTCCRSNQGSKASIVAKLDRNGIVVGHIPQLLSKRLAILLDSKEGIKITGTITDLPREAPGGRWVRGGGLELPCEYVIRGKKEHRTAVAEALEEVRRVCVRVCLSVSLPVSVCHWGRVRGSDKDLWTVYVYTSS